MGRGGRPDRASWMAEREGEGGIAAASVAEDVAVVGAARRVLS